MKQSDVGNCNDRYCEYYNEGMELNCSYSIDNSKCIKTKKPITSHAVLSEVRADIDKILQSEIDIANCGDKSTDRLVALARVIEKIDHHMLG